MAKKKAPEDDTKPAGPDISKEITSTYGEGVMINASAILDEDTMIIPVSPSIDIGLNGGIPEGSWVTFTGLPKKGKTSLSLHIAAKCQQEQYGARDVYYLNIEGRLKKMNLNGIKGLNINKLKIISSLKGNILSAEQFLAIGEKIATTIPGSVIIIDSYSALCTENENTKGMDEQQRADGQKLLAKFCRRMATIVPVNKNIIIGITHLMGNPTGYGGDREKGGYAIAYQADIKLKAGTVEKLTTKAGKQYGQKVEWEVQVSALGPPGAKVWSTIRYGKGIDEIADLTDTAIDLGIVEQKGAWYNFNQELFSSKDPGLAQKFCGKDALVEVLESAEYLADLVKEQIKKMVYTEI